MHIFLIHIKNTNSHKVHAIVIKSMVIVGSIAT